MQSRCEFSDIKNELCKSKAHRIRSHDVTELSSFVSIDELIEAKKVALRRRVWFRVLNQIERGVLDLTVRYVDEVKSSKLAKVLMTILKKLAFATERNVDRLVRTIGIAQAKIIGDLAVGWGNFSASTWAFDFKFARFLALTSAKTASNYNSQVLGGLTFG